MKTYATEIPQERDIEEYGNVLTCSENRPPPSGWPRSGALAFDGVALRYRDGLPLVLRDVSLRIASGEKVGIVGRTGSGKSTIMLALFRIVELARGTISLDGVDVARLKLADLRGNITIIPQDPVLYAGTLRSNLDPFNACSDAELVAVVRKVGMWPRVEAEGLDAVVADKGANFSVGQRQLLCLARAILKRSRVLLLDEATASCSPETDALIQRTVRTEFGDCTVLTIAHRLATVIDADRILVMDDGTVAEFGTPKELLDNSHGAFYSMLSSLGEDQFLDLYNQANYQFSKNAVCGFGEEVIDL